MGFPSPRSQAVGLIAVLIVVVCARLFTRQVESLEDGGARFVPDHVSPESIQAEEHFDPTRKLLDPSVRIDPPEESDRLRIGVEVVDNILGNPVPGAKIWDGSEEIDFPNVLGLTDELGRWTNPAESVDSNLELVIEARGFQTMRGIRLSVSGEWTRVTLARDCTITGRLHFRHDAPDFDGFSVYAWPIAAGARPDTGRATSLRQSALDSTGAFAFDSLPCGQNYYVAASGPGWVSPEPLAVRVGGVAVQLAMEALYGLAFRLTDFQGLQLPDTPLFSEVPRGSIRPYAEGAQYFRLKGPHLQRFEIPEGQTPGINDSIRTCLFVAEADEDSYGELSYRAIRPGFEAQNIRLAAPRVWNDLQVVDLEMHPTAAPVGELWLRVVPLGCAILPNLGSRSPDLSIALTSLDRTIEGIPVTYGLAIQSLVEPEAYCAQVPVGRYRVSIRGASGALQLPGPEDLTSSKWNLTITEGLTEFEIELLGLGSVEVKVNADKHRQYEAALGLHLSSAMGSRQRSHHLFSFDRPPYRIPALPPGKYWISVSLASVDGDEVEFVVKPGIVTGVKLSMPSG